MASSEPQFILQIDTLLGTSLHPVVASASPLRVAIPRFALVQEEKGLWIPSSSHLILPPNQPFLQHLQSIKMAVSTSLRIISNLVSHSVPYVTELAHLCLFIPNISPILGQNKVHNKNSRAQTSLTATRSSQTRSFCIALSNKRLPRPRHNHNFSLHHVYSGCCCGLNFCSSALDFMNNHAAITG